MTSITLKDKKYPADAPLIIENGVADSITLDGCENVIIRNMKVGDQGAGDVRMLTNRPVQISNSKGISFTGNDVSRGSIGLTLDNVTDSLIDANLFHELNEDGIRPLDTDNVTISRNEFTDFRVNLGKHPDAVQPWNPHLGRPSDGLKIIDNCAHRGNGDKFQGISVRYQDPAGANSKGWSSYINLEVSRNLVIGLANGITVSGRGGCEDNEVVSFTDLLSKITRTGTGVTLKGNKAKQYKLDTFSKLAPVDNYLNTAIDPSQEAALVAAWRARVFATPVEAPTEPIPVSVGVSFTQAQKDAVRAALASIGAI